MTILAARAAGPRITRQGDAWVYDDGVVHGVINVDQHSANRLFAGLMLVAPAPEFSGVTIEEWSSEMTGAGNTVQALEWLRERFSRITANQAGFLEAEVGISPSLTYWREMQRRGLVDDVLDDDGVEVRLPHDTHGGDAQTQRDLDLIWPHTPADAVRIFALDSSHRRLGAALRLLPEDSPALHVVPDGCFGSILFHAMDVMVNASASGIAGMEQEVRRAARCIEMLADAGAPVFNREGTPNAISYVFLDRNWGETDSATDIAGVMTSMIARGHLDVHSRMPAHLTLGGATLLAASFKTCNAQATRILLEAGIETALTLSDAGRTDIISLAMEYGVGQGSPITALLAEHVMRAHLRLPVSQGDAQAFPGYKHTRRAAL